MIRCTTITTASTQSSHCACGNTRAQAPSVRFAAHAHGSIRAPSDRPSAIASLSPRPSAIPGLPTTGSGSLLDPPPAAALSSLQGEPARQVYRRLIVENEKAMDNPVRGSRPAAVAWLNCWVRSTTPPARTRSQPASRANAACSARPSRARHRLHGPGSHGAGSEPDPETIGVPRGMRRAPRSATRRVVRSARQSTAHASPNQSRRPEALARRGFGVPIHPLPCAGWPGTSTVTSSPSTARSAAPPPTSRGDCSDRQCRSDTLRTTNRCPKPTSTSLWGCQLLAVIGRAARLPGQIPGPLTIPFSDLPAQWLPAEREGLVRRMSTEAQTGREAMEAMTKLFQVGVEPLRAGRSRRSSFYVHRREQLTKPALSRRFPAPVRSAKLGSRPAG